jgi:histone deacetylase 6
LVFFSNPQAMSAATIVKGETGLIYDERMTQHLCIWDKGHPECPDRFTWVLQRCRDYQLDSRCKILKSRLATKDEILLKHTDEQYELLKSTFKSTNEEQLEDLSSRYDAIFFHPVSMTLFAFWCKLILILVYFPDNLRIVLTVCRQHN